MAYQLYRTNLSLTGNVKLCCYVDSGEVSKCSLNPLTSLSAIIPHEINTETSKLGLDIANFYKDYSSIFYTPQIDSKYLCEDKYRTLIPEDTLWNGNIGDCQYGLKRISQQKNGKQFSVLAPIFINNEEELPTHVNIQCCNKNGREMFSRSICIDKSTSIGKYLLRSYEHINGTRLDDDGNKTSIQQPRIMYVSPKSENGIGGSTSTLQGWSTISGGHIVLSSNLPQKIFKQDKTLTEFDAYVCDEFRSHNIIVPHIINFCWYFDLDDLTNISRLDIKYGDIIKIKIRYFRMNEDGSCTYLFLGDLDMNHYNISDGSSENVLDYLHERDLDEIRSNQTLHLTPTISKWSLCDSNKYIFNNFVGFENSNLNYHIDTLKEERSREANNIAWMSPIATSSIYPEYQSICAGDFDISTFINGSLYKPGIKILYQENIIKKYKINSTDDIYTCLCNNILFRPTKDYEYLSISYITNSTSILGKSTNTVLIVDDNDKSINIVMWIPESVRDIYESSSTNDLSIRKVFIDKTKKIEIDYIINAKDWSYKTPETTEYITDYTGEFVNPQYVRINKLLQSKQKNDNTWSLIQDLRESPTVLSRYYGWIQPRIIEVNSSGIPSENDYVFTKTTDNEVNPTSYGSLTVRDMTSSDCNFNTSPFDAKIERRWFDDSKYFYLPTQAQKTYSYSEKKDTTIDDCLDDIFREILRPNDEMKKYWDVLFLYMKNIYRYMIDADIKKENFIIKVILK